jgi:hypothetical protein
MEWSDRTKAALAAYAEAKKALDIAHEKLRESAFGDSPLKQGDTLRIGEGAKAKVGRVVKLQFRVYEWRGALEVSVQPEVFPLKKDGTPASNGRMYVDLDSKFRIIPPPEPEKPKKRNPEDSEEVNGITRTYPKWPTKAVLSEKLKVHSPSGLSEISKPGIYLDKGEHGKYQVVHRTEKTDPHGPWYNNGHMTFYEREGEPALDAAMQWAFEKYGIDTWCRDPFGCWQRTEVYDAVIYVTRKHSGKGAV